MKTKKNRNDILMVYVLFSTFAKRDYFILKKKYNVTLYHFNTTKKYYLPYAFIKQFLFLLFNTHKYKTIVTQSSGYLSFLPVIFGKIFKKNVVIIAIGTDCAKLPEINYGSHSKKLQGWFTNFSFKNASLIATVHKSLEKTLYTYDKVIYPDQGIRSFNKNINTKITEVVYGYDTEKWQIINPNDRIKNSFLTVTVPIDKVGYYRKGIDLIVNLSKIFTNYQFTIVGKVYLEEKCPENITIINNVPQEELIKIYNKHEFYFQLSMFEGFPNTLCEAMLCGCIPIGSDVAGIPDIIGNSGYILKEKNIKLLEEIVLGLNKNTIMPEQARNQIKDNFPLERREKELLNCIA